MLSWDSITNHLSLNIKLRKSPLIHKDFQECERRPLRGPRGAIHWPWCELTRGLASTSCHWGTASSRLMEILVGKSYRSGETVGILMNSNICCLGNGKKRLLAHW